MKLAELAGASERTEVDHRDIGPVRVQRARELVAREPRGDELEAVVLLDQRPQAASDDVLELADRDRHEVLVRVPHRVMSMSPESGLSVTRGSPGTGDDSCARVRHDLEAG